jgi:DNA polymerase-3 subunit delta
MPMVVSMLYTHFNRILRYHALIQAGQGGDSAAKAKVLGVNPYFFKEYDAAVKKYSLKQAMRVISLLNDYDFKGKGGEVGEATPADLLVELTTKILNI